MRGILLVIDLHMEGCSSLKEKRQRLKGFLERWGKQAQVAVCESDYQDSHQRAQWSFVIAGQDMRQVHQVLARLEEDLHQSVDARISGRHQEPLF